MKSMCKYIFSVEEKIQYCLWDIFITYSFLNKFIIYTFSCAGVCPATLFEYVCTSWHWERSAVNSHFVICILFLIDGKNLKTSTSWQRSELWHLTFLILFGWRLALLFFTTTEGFLWLLFNICNWGWWYLPWGEWCGSWIKEKWVLLIGLLTWLQPAVEVEDDHNETSQTQGKDHPSDFGFPHPESLEMTNKPSTILPGSLRKTSSICPGGGVYLITDMSIDPARWPPLLLISLHILGRPVRKTQRRWREGAKQTSQAAVQAALSGRSASHRGSLKLQQTGRASASRGRRSICVMGTR